MGINKFDLIPDRETPITQIEKDRLDNEWGNEYGDSTISLPFLFSLDEVLEKETEEE